MGIQRNANIRALFLDFGNVCATFDWSRLYRELQRHTVFFSDSMELHLHNALPRLERGETGQEAFVATFCRSLRMGSDLDFRRFADIFCMIFDEAQPHADDLKRLLLSVRPDVQKLLVSNTNPIHWNRYVRKHWISKVIRDDNDRIRSYKVGATKPDAPIYTAALTRARVGASEALLVDDAKENVDAFRWMGGNATKWNAKQDPVERLEAIFLEYGLIR